MTLPNWYIPLDPGLAKRRPTLTPPLWHDPLDPMPYELLREADYAQLEDFAVRNLQRAWDISLQAPDNDELLDQLQEAWRLVDDVVIPSVPQDWDATEYTEAQRFTATKNPNNPHAYVVLRNAKSWRNQLKFGRYIRQHGKPETFGGYWYMYADVGDHHYWTMNSNDTIINRKRLDGGDPAR